jgi:hypothetical protein
VRRVALGALAALLSLPGTWAVAGPSSRAASPHSTTENRRGELSSVIPTVKKWLGHLEEGRSRKAWQLMTPESRHQIGGYDAFKAEASAWAEGWGAWAKAGGRDFEIRVIAPMDDDAASVVTMTGRVSHDGPPERSAAALPVRTNSGVTKVDPVHGPARVRAVRPRSGATISVRPRFEAIVRRIRARSNSVYFIVKGSRLQPQKAHLRRVDDHVYRARLRWPRSLSAGPHVLTIASWGRHGFEAEAVRFKVEG